MGRGTRGEEEYINGKKRREGGRLQQRRKRRRGESMKVDLIYGCDSLQRLQGWVHPAGLAHTSPTVTSATGHLSLGGAPSTSNGIRCGQGGSVGLGNDPRRPSPNATAGDGGSAAEAVNTAAAPNKSSLQCSRA